MLQQTTVAVAAPRWIRFLQRFPTLRDLSHASEDAVLAEWSGLGYYSRARNLRRAAQALASRPGELPRSAREWRELPGIGAYTAAAVCSIAFGEPAAAVDGNVRRVLRRMHGILTEPGGAREQGEIQRIADAWIPKARPGDHNQALMELGATLCLPREPRCPACPLRSHCRAFALGAPERFSARPKSPPPVAIRLAAGVALRSGQIVLVPDVWIVKGHLIVPIAQVPADGDAAESLRKAWPRLTGREARKLLASGTLSHSVLNRRYMIELFVVSELARKKKSEPTDVTLVSPSRLDEIARGAVCDKIELRALSGSGERGATHA